MGIRGERFKMGVQATVEGFKEFVHTHDVMKATKKVKEKLEDYLEEEENKRRNA